MELPEWIATLIGRLTLENEALRQALAEAQKWVPQAAENGHVPAEEPVAS